MPKAKTKKRQNKLRSNCTRRKKQKGGTWWSCKLRPHQLNYFSALIYFLGDTLNYSQNKIEFKITKLQEKYRDLVILKNYNINKIIDDVNQSRMELLNDFINRVHKCNQPATKFLEISQPKFLNLVDTKSQEIVNVVRQMLLHEQPPPYAPPTTPPPAYSPHSETVPLELFEQPTNTGATTGQSPPQ